MFASGEYKRSILTSSWTSPGGNKRTFIGVEEMKDTFSQYRCRSKRFHNQPSSDSLVLLGMHHRLNCIKNAIPGQLASWFVLCFAVEPNWQRMPLPVQHNLFSWNYSLLFSILGPGQAVPQRKSLYGLYVSCYNEVAGFPCRVDFDFPQTSSVQKIYFYKHIYR